MRAQAIRPRANEAERRGPRRPVVTEDVQMRTSIAAFAAALLASCGGQSGNQQAAPAGNEAAPAAATGAGAAAGATALQPGLWEITTEVLRMEVPNMPQGISAAPPPTTVRSCLTPEQANAPTGGFFAGSDNPGGCTAENMSMADGRIQGVVQCNQPGSAMRSTMEGRFSAASFQVNQSVETRAQGMDMTIQSRTSGRRVGECTG